MEQNRTETGRIKQDQTELLVIHHTHWDREWYESFEAMQIRLRDMIRHIVRLIEEEKISGFYLDGQTAVLDDYRQVASEQEFNKLEALIRSGNIEIGPWYVLADEFLCPPEAMIKNLELGMEMAENYHGFYRMGYLPDTFGHISSMPQILKQFNIPCALIWRGANPENCEVVWKGSDGSAVNTMVLPTRDGYFQTFLKHETYAEELENYILFHREEKKAGRILLMDGADHTVCDTLALEHLRRFGKDHGINCVETSMEETSGWLESLSPAGEICGELRNNSKIYVLSGTWSARMYLKVWNQRCTDRLIHQVEFLNAWERDRSDSKDLKTQMWKQLLVNQAHDSICGCSIDEVHNEMVSRYERLLQSADKFSEVVLEQLYPYEYRKEDPNQWLHVIHNLPYRERRLVKAEICLDRSCDLGGISLYEDGREIPVQIRKREEKEEFFHKTICEPWYKDVVVYQIEFFLDFDGIESRCLLIRRVTERAEYVSAKIDTVENRHYRIEVKEGQLLVTERAGGKVHRNQHRIVSSLDSGDTYSYSPPACDEESIAEIIYADGVKDAFRQELEVGYVLNVPRGLNEERTGASEERISINVKSSFTLYEDDPVIYVKSQVENKAYHHKLRIGFQIEPCEEHFGDTAFDLVRRFTRPEEKCEVGAGEETVWNQNPTYSQVYAGGLQLIHAGMQEYEVENREGESCCYLTALRCVGDLSRRDLRTRGGGAGPGYLTPEAQCIGTYEFEYGMIYGEGLASGLHSLRLRTAPLVKQSFVRSERRKLFSLSPEVQFSSLCWKEGGYQLRVFNQQERQAAFILESEQRISVQKTNLGRTDTTPCGEGNRMELTAEPKEIITLLLSMDEKEVSDEKDCLYSAG